MEHHLFLVGYRGSGKTSVGQCLAERLGIPVVDSDKLVEEDAGKSIREIFAEVGESGFRDIESRIVHQLAEFESPHIISLGGGAILRSENRQTIRKRGVAVWLKASPDQLAARIHGDSTTAERRPALTNLTAHDEIEKLLEIREPLYREVATWIVKTDGRDIHSIADEINQNYLEHQRITQSKKVV
jgi:shikimate kinase